MTATPTPPARRRRDLLAFDRSDRVGMYVLLAAVGTATAFVLLVDPLVRWWRGDGAPVRVTGEVEVPVLEAAEVAHGTAQYVVFLPDAGAGSRLALLVPGALVCVLLVVGAWLVVRVMRDVAAGDPFAPRNVRRLRGLAGLLVLGAPVAFVIDGVVSSAVLSGVGLDDVTASRPLFSIWFPVTAGMVTALLAEAFAAGSRLRADVEGLV